ncbi:MAG: hypothetical protein DRP16_04110 [Candidatus Aenigmatarchaeota archaeon]|nr:MAG: hypothetical protein DRP16_04110 [Candidatus Aenigmarchaeota archaeon]
MANPWLLFSGIGMVLVGLFAVFWWRRKSKVEYRYFVFGSVVWVICTLTKVIIDIGTKGLFGFLQTYPVFLALIVSGLYTGLRTGFIESGFAYLFVSKTNIKKRFEEAVAFGIGFGSIEAIILGASSFISILVFLLYPPLIQTVPEAYRQALITELNMNSLVVFAPVIERIMTIIIHIFAFSLVFYAVKSRNNFYLVFSVLFKALVDGIIPFLLYTFQKNTLAGIYSIESVVVCLGVFAFFGTERMRVKFQ